jgi:hypothetical protein
MLCAVVLAAAVSAADSPAASALAALRRVERAAVPAARAAALREMAEALDQLAQGEAEGTGPLRARHPGLARAVAAALAASDRDVVLAALPAARALNMAREPDLSTLWPLLDLARKSPDRAVRVAVADELVQFNAYLARSEPVFRIFAAALDDADPAVVDTALQALFAVVGSEQLRAHEPGAIETALARLRRHPDPAIRVWALTVTGKRFEESPIVIPGLPAPPSDPAREVARAEVAAALADPAPVVRAVAAMAAAHMQHHGVVPRVLSLLDDAGSTAFTPAWTRPPGREREWSASWASGEPREVRTAALAALSMLAVGVDPRDRLLCEDPTTQMAKCVKDAKAWFARHRSAPR